MEKLINFSFRLIGISLFLVFFVMHIATYAQTIKRWKTTGGQLDWNVNNNWDPSGIPAPTDIVVFDAGNKICGLDMNRSVGGIIMNGYTGTIDTRGYTLTLTGDNTFTTGNVQSGRIELNTTGTTIFNGTSFSSGDIVGSSGRILFNGSYFDTRVFSVTKTGNVDDFSIGGNAFNSLNPIIFTNASSSVWRFANVTGDNYGYHITFVNTGTGSLEPAYNSTNSFYRNIITNSTSTIIFGAGTGVVLVTGSFSQSINYAGGVYPVVINRLEMNKSTNSLTLNVPVTIGISATFTNGIVNSSSSSYIDFADNAISSNANNLSYADGPVRKTGNDAFEFPVGDNGSYRPISISAPANIMHYFTAQYFNTAQTFGANKDVAINTMSDCEYWILDRSPSGSDVNVTLSWNSPLCPKYGITDLSHMRVIRWNGTQWQNHGNGVTTGNTTAGTVRTAAPVAAFSPFTLGSSSALSPLPIELVSFEVKELTTGEVFAQWKTASEIKNSHFIIEHSSTGKEFHFIGRVEGNGTTKEVKSYSFTDTKPFPGKNYYRLVQFDLDGKKEYSQIRYVNIEATDKSLQISIYPNPAKNEIKIASNHFIQKARVVFYDLLSGVIVLEKDFDSFAWEQSLDINSIKSGLYRVYISSDKGNTSEKVVVVK